MNNNLRNDLLNGVMTSSAKAGDVFSDLGGVNGKPITEDTSNKVITDEHAKRLADIQEALYTGLSAPTTKISAEDLESITNRPTVKDPDAPISNLALSNQTAANKILSSVNRTVFGELIGGTIQGVGALLDIAAKPFEATATGIYNAFADEPANSVPYENFITRFGKDITESVNKANPIYRENPDKSFDFGDVGYWAENAPSVISSVSSMFTGAAVGKGVAIGATHLNKIYGAAKAADKMTTLTKSLGIAAKVAKNSKVQAGIAAVTNRTIENYREANDAYHSSLELSKEAFANMNVDQWNTYLESNKGLAEEAKQKFGTSTPSTEQMSKLIAEKTADKSAINNSMNLVFDFIQFSSLGKLLDNVSDAGLPLSRKLLEAQSESIIKAGGKGLTKEVINEQLIKSYGKRAGLWALGTLSEGPEEMINELSARASEQYSKDLIVGNEVGFMSPFEQMSAYGGDPKLWEAGLWGVIGGMVFGAGAKGLSKVGAKINSAREEKGLTKWFGVSDTEVERRKAIADINNRESIMQIAASQINAIDNGINPYNGEVIQNGEDKHLKELVTKDAIRTLANNAAKNGTTPLLKEYLNDSDVFDTFDKTLSSIGLNKHFVNDEIEKSSKDYEEAYNSMFFEDDISGHINDIIIDRYVQRKQMLRDIKEESESYNEYKNSLTDQNSPNYNDRVANNPNKDNLLWDLRLSTYQDIRDSIEAVNATTDAQKLEKKIQLEAIDSLIGTFEGAAPARIDSAKAAKAQEDHNIDPSRTIDQAIRDFQEAHINIMNNRGKSDIIKEADTIVQLIQNQVNNAKESAKTIIQNKIGSVLFRSDLDKAVEDINNLTLENDKDNDRLLILKEASTKDEWESLIKSFVDKKIDEFDKAEHAAKVEAERKAAELANAKPVQPITTQQVEPSKPSTSPPVEASTLVNNTPEPTESKPTESKPTTNNPLLNIDVPVKSIEKFDDIIHYKFSINPNKPINLGSKNAVKVVAFEGEYGIELSLYNDDNVARISYRNSDDIDSINNLIAKGELIATIDQKGKDAIAANRQWVADRQAEHEQKRLAYEARMAAAKKVAEEERNKSFSTTSDETKEAAKNLSSGSIVVTKDTALNYNYELLGKSRVRNVAFDAVELIPDGYGGLELNLYDKGDFAETFSDDEALDIINLLIENESVDVTPIIDESIKASAIVDDLFSTELDKVNRFIESSLKDRGVKIKAKGKTSISLLDLIFHAMDATNDIDKTLIIKDKLISAFDSYKDLRNKYNILDSDLDLLRSNHLARSLTKGRTVYIDQLIKESKSDTSIDINTTIVEQIFDPKKFRTNGKYLLSETDKSVLEAISAIQTADKKNPTRVFVTKDGNTTNVVIDTEKGLLKIGELPTAAVDKQGVTHSVVKGLRYDITGNNVTVIDTLIKKLRDMDGSAFTDLYADLLDYKRKYTDDRSLIPSLLDHPVISSITAEFGYTNENVNVDPITILDHLANIITFKDVSVDYQNPNRNKEISISLLEDWKAKVISNNNYYKQFNNLKEGEQVEMRIGAVNKGVLNKHAGNKIPLGRSFSKQELTDAKIGVGRLTYDTPYTAYAGRTSGKVDTPLPTAGGTYLIVKDGAGRDLRVNLNNSSLNDALDIKHSVRANEFRKTIKDDIKVTFDKLISEVVKGGVSKETLDQVHLMVGYERATPEGVPLPNHKGMVSGVQMMFRRTDTGFTLSKRVGGVYTNIGFNFINHTNSAKFSSNVSIQVGKGKVEYLNNKNSDIAKANKAIEEFFYLKDGVSNFFQVNTDADKSLANEPYSYKSISTGKTFTYDSYKDYLIKEEVVYSDVVGSTNKNGVGVVTGFVPNNSQTGSGATIGNNLSIQLTSIKEPVNTTNTVTKLPVEPDPTEPVIEQKLTDIISNVLKTSNKPSDIIAAIDPDSKYNELAEFLDNTGVTIDNEVKVVGESHGGFTIPDVYGYYKPAFKIATLTSKLDSTNKDNAVRTIVHETVHGYLSSNNFNYNNLQYIFDEAKKANDPILNVYFKAWESNKSLTNEAMLEEFLVEALTSRAFAKGLSKIKSIDGSTKEGTDLLSRLLRLIKDFVKANDPSLLDDINRVINNIESKVSEDNRVKQIESEPLITIKETADEIHIQTNKEANDTDTGDIQLDVSSDNFDLFESAINDQASIENMVDYKNGLPEYLQKEYDKNIDDGNITFICY